MSSLTTRTLIFLTCALTLAQVSHLVFPAMVGGLIGFILAVALSFVLVLGMAYLLGNQDAALIARAMTFIKTLEGGQAPDPIVTPRRDELGELMHALNRLTNRDKAVQQANSDALTGLANRRGVLQKLEAAYKAGKPLALFYIDLDKFKPINDTYGHEAGDAVLRRVAELFTAAVRDNDLVARLGGDEFLIILFGMTDRDQLSERAQKIIDLVSEPMWVNDVRVKLGASIGITVGPQDGATVEALMAAADETMYAVKKAGRNGFKFYS
ncbi:MAG: hypothetical protein COY40_02775 [Alphaproteobacteria bacterium CG_4_10_14_0_8_um_filter_53_9]|nr:MAG: hypothetical protein COY40_02775 [Alphaproteobacteria bacterium CG_4_10_14_0_8_um_filter_53_9]